MNKYEKQLASDIAEAAIKAGYRAFIADNKTYGFYTDADGTKVISFQCNGLCVSVSGNYKTSKPAQTGTGWRIADEFNTRDIRDYFNQSAPHWAVGDAKWDYTSLDQHLATYQWSSKYVEMQPWKNLRSLQPSPA